ncbi:two-component system C4-dicarboxylate transport sensor histidine kinase DctB [Pseudochelatococcus lubricantis]|uniref:histidine kinase n=1 Tax=Pseudochelatococcus lubricantis TaxID=1538102 RepID=A0ABX0UZH7_9HYPH|nr:ATP-binding protein [Pseudochelatococcus lubricantis]NIJ58336.1 two-component system C4-dicarboxylate transport sensor histidine kinase DctB [Pseudochelatococcus lubricantis]
MDSSLVTSFRQAARRPLGLLRGRPGFVWVVYAVAAALLLAAALSVGGERGRARAYAALGDRARHTAVINAALLRTVLEKQRSLPFVLTQDAEVQAALADENPARLQALNVKFETLAEGTRASVIYLLNRSGLTLAASNWRTPISFVGNDYSFRPYFLDALGRGAAEYYALGTASRVPGLYITRRIEGPGGVTGVVVVKVQFDQVEEDWRNAPEISYVSDAHDVVVVSRVPEWRFRTIATIAESDKQALRKSLQFGDAPLTPVPVTPVVAAGTPDIVTALLPGAAAPSRFLRTRVPVPSTQWTLHLLAAVDREAKAAAYEGRLTATALVAPLLAAAGWLVHRHNRNQRRAAESEAARAELERRVRDRTRELSTANERLQSEVLQRQEAVTRLQEMREELAQANRLAILGQVSAGIAHDINQPTAAIRSYADNAQVLLQRNRNEAVRENLAAIASLTQRISTIMEDLRAFARRRTGGLEATAVTQSIEGALLLLHNRLRQQGVEMVCNMPPQEVKVVGNRIRLEQVLVNLMQNAIEAMEGRPGSRLELDWRTQENEVLLSVRDNGPGIPDEVMQRLFTPFTTTKQGGLGLGHVICNDIVTAFGGSLDVESSPERGTCFTIHLKRIEDAESAREQSGRTDHEPE